MYARDAEPAQPHSVKGTKMYNLESGAIDFLPSAPKP